MQSFAPTIRTCLPRAWAAGLYALSMLFASLLDIRGFAGGSGLNTVVVVNQSSSNSCALGNYYCEKRQVPPENLLRINWAGSITTWSSNDFQTVLLGPLLNMLNSRGLTNQIEYVVLSMDIPFQTTSGTAWNGTTSALFYGVKDQYSGPLISSSYYTSERSFRSAEPASAQGFSFLATMITGNTLADARAVADQGAASDGTFPAGPVVLAKSSDSVRNMRYTGFDSAIINGRIGGQMKMMRTNMDEPVGLSNLLGLQTGLARFTISPNTFAPGAMADSLTSFAGLLFDAGSGQTPLLAFLRAGAAGSYGTITEPGADPNKFPTPQNYFYQSRGFTLAECYYQSIYVPYQGIVVGEPLAAPFARAGAAAWLSPGSNAVLSGTASLSARIQAADAEHPIQQVDLFVDGKFFQTITNIPLQPGNQLTVNLGSNPVTYTIAAQDTLESAASNLVALLQAPAATNATKAIAAAHGDRIELRSIGGQRVAAPGAPRSFAAGASNSGATIPFFSSTAGGQELQTAWLVPARETFLNSPAQGLITCRVVGVVPVGAWLQMDVVKTNGSTVSVSITNQASGATSADLASQLVNAINMAPGLQGIDGLLVEDLITDYSGRAQFNVRARAPGYFAAGLTIRLSATNTVNASPSVTMPLRANLADLQPRNHLYVRCGVPILPVDVSFDTRLLSDGFHDLTLVGYEGSSVRTQSKATLPVQIKNSSLEATLGSSDLTNGVSVSATCSVQVSANTNAIRTIQLFSTGGQLGAATNQSNATFLVNGAHLGVGLHPFYALVQPVAGPAFRTRTTWVRLGD